VRRIARRSGPVAVAALAALALAVPTGGGAVKPTRNTVSMSEFEFAFVPKTARVGTVIFTVVNEGKIAHDFELSAKKTPRFKARKTPELAAGKRAVLRVTFAKPGRYPYLCTLPGHAAGGMKGVLVVEKRS
jgi:uncharacterized cupredoxin-like copper-binding protein